MRLTPKGEFELTPENDYNLTPSCFRHFLPLKN